MNELKEKIQAQLEQLNDRERVMVYAAVVALLIFIPYTVIWVPLTNSVEEKRTRVEKQEADLVWMQSNLSEVKRLSQMSGTGGSNTGQPLYGVVESTARQKFGSDIRIQQEGKNGIRIRISNSSFDELMIWLDDLQFRHKIVVKDCKVTSENTPGRVEASILVES